MNRYEPMFYEEKSSLTILFELMTDRNKKKRVTIFKDDLVSVLVAKNKQEVLEPVTNQDVLDKMVYRGRISKIL